MKKLSIFLIGIVLGAGAAAGWASGPGPEGAPEEQKDVRPLPAARCNLSVLSSPYIPVDSWVYPAVYRLYSLGFVDTVYLGMRPWTRTSVVRMLEEAEPRIEDDMNTPEGGQAEDIYESLMHELRFDLSGPCYAHRGQARVESVYSVIRGISGTPLRDSFHLGSTIVNDYGRPYQGGFNNYTGASGYASSGRYSLYVRGEFQRAPSGGGYSLALAEDLGLIDQTYGVYGNFIFYNQPTIPLGPIASATNGRIMEAVVSARLADHEISFGKQDEWQSPAQGGAMGYSNNAENIYSFRINRVEPLHIPLLSRVTGPFRYEFLVGALQGHTEISDPSYIGPNQNPPVPNVISPGNPWVHVEKVSFRPMPDMEVGFARTVIWGGKGHEPITLHTFLKSFFSFQNVTAAEKFGPTDPGARFSQFDFSYRLPFMRKWLTLYTDSEVHDDITALSAPRRASWRPGLYLSHVPGVPRLDLRAEGVTTDPPTSRSTRGQFMYWEYQQVMGYTNQGQLFGDWIGREDKGGQAWLTYHLSGNEWLQVNYRRQKASKDFIATPTAQYGTTLDDVGFQAVKRIGKDFEVNGSFTLEHYKAPIYLPGQQTVTTTNVQFTWFPSRKTSF